ncbi:shikimate dehydrogenase [Chloroflexota bacterium]
MVSGVSGRTKVCGVIGDPVEHTMSPAMHNAAFASMGLDYIYLPFRVKAEELARAIDGMRGLNIKGLNVTIPHKVAVIPLLDKLDPLAENIGAVNTITNDNGVLKGSNTDAGGFMQSLLFREIELRERGVAILGAGGAARAISFALADRGANLTILNRQLEMDWAKELACKLETAFRKEVKVRELTADNLAAALEGADILVNATSVGMSPDTDETPVPARLLRVGLMVIDIIYNPIETKLLRDAGAVGARTISGIDMFIWQGALAFEEWTGAKAPLEVMRAEVVRRLAGHEE